MSKFLKKTLYLSLSALMVGSVGTATNGFVNPSHVSAHRTSRHYKPRARVTSRWNRTSVAFNRGLNGRSAVYDRPQMLRHAHQVYSTRTIRRAMRHGARFSAYKGAEVNHHYCYYKVESNHGHIHGWVLASSVYRIRGHRRVRRHTRRHANSNRSNDSNALSNLNRDVISGELSADYSRIGNDDKFAHFAWDRAQDYLNQAQQTANSISGKRARNRANQMVNSFENYLSGVKQVHVNNQNNLNNIINRDVNAASTYLTAASYHSNNSRANLSIAKSLLKDATTKNQQLDNANVAKDNSTMIANANNYAKLIEDRFNINPKPKRVTNGDRDVLPSEVDHHNSGKPAVNPNESMVMSNIRHVTRDAITNINSLNKEIKARNAKVSHGQVSGDTAEVKNAMQKAAAIRSDISDIKSMQNLIHNSNDSSLVNYYLRNIQVLTK